MDPKVEPTANAESAYVAMRYTLGARGAETLVGLRKPSRGAQALAKSLVESPKEARVQLLGREIARILVGVKRLETL